jgi:hypothetical protein
MALGRLFDLGGRARVRPAARVLVPDQPLDFGMGDGAAAMNQQRTVNAVRTASEIPVSGRGLSPSAGPYLELFARETKPGWKCWGRFGFSRDTSATLTLSRCPPAIGVTRRAIPSCCRGFVCYVCAFITRAQRAGISDTCDAASGRCCVQRTPAAAAFGGTLAGWPPPRSRLFGEEVGAGPDNGVKARVTV